MEFLNCQLRRFFNINIAKKEKNKFNCDMPCLHICLPIYNVQHVVSMYYFHVPLLNLRISPPFSTCFHMINHRWLIRILPKPCHRDTCMKRLRATSIFRCFLRSNHPAVTSMSLSLVFVEPWYFRDNHGKITGKFMLRFSYLPSISGFWGKICPYTLRKLNMVPPRNEKENHLNPTIIFRSYVNLRVCTVLNLKKLHPKSYLW